MIANACAFVMQTVHCSSWVCVEAAGCHILYSRTRTFVLPFNWLPITSAAVGNAAVAGVSFASSVGRGNACG
jgi:hypothetical protein